MISTPNSPDAPLQVTPAGTPSSAKLSVIGFYGLAVIFNLCLVAQMTTVGLAEFHNPVWWNAHVALVRAYSGLSLILLLWVFGPPFSRRIRILTVSLPLLLGIQFLSMHLQIPLPLPLAVVHPLVGFVLFSVSTTLVHRVSNLVPLPFGCDATNPKTANPN
ncbi:MAG: DUF6220 domain-containing protein [Synechococcales bacterium]|nr:DUF6220 domain-containing protein [Synechococcales bacterium]